MELRPIRARELFVDAAADERVDEPQRQIGLEQARARQQLGCLGRVGLLELRESSRVNQAALLEHRQRPSQSSRIVR